MMTREPLKEFPIRCICVHNKKTYQFPMTVKSTSVEEALLLVGKLYEVHYEGDDPAYMTSEDKLNIWKKLRKIHDVSSPQKG
jgi:hypothetical protein